jgi:proteasome lid subunit RPN8/RPN11
VIEIPAGIREEMIRHAVGGSPNEVCGLLAGVDSKVERFYPIKNVHQDPRIRFVLDPKEYVETMEDMEGSDLQLVATFHSHSHTAAYPSATDVDQSEGIQRFYPNAKFVLVSLQALQPDVRAYSITGDHVEEQEVRIT